MAHFAELDHNNIVLQVTVVNNSVCLDLSGKESEDIGITFCKFLFGKDTRWVQTSYNKNIRKNYAAIGYTYDKELDAFIPPKPYSSWILNEETADWISPVGPAPCTIEFNKQAGSTDNGLSYAMMGWNADPTTDANYTSLDYASYPYVTTNYSVYHNGTSVLFSGAWSTSNTFYIVYGTDGFIRHYNGSTQLYSVSYGVGNTVYVDSSFYSVNATFGGFSNIRVIRRAWNGTSYS